MEAGDQLGGSFSVQVRDEGGSQYSEEWPNSGQIVMAETTGFADGLGVESERGDSQSWLQALGLSPGCCGLGVGGGQMGIRCSQDRTSLPCLSGSQVETSGRHVGLGQRSLAWEPSACGWNLKPLQARSVFPALSPHHQSHIKKRLFMFRFGDRRTRMNWVHVCNLVQAHVLAAEALTASKGYVAVSLLQCSPDLTPRAAGGSPIPRGFLAHTRHSSPVQAA